MDGKFGKLQQNKNYPMKKITINKEEEIELTEREEKIYDKGHENGCWFGALVVMIFLTIISLLISLFVKK